MPYASPFIIPPEQFDREADYRSSSAPPPQTLGKDPVLPLMTDPHFMDPYLAYYLSQQTAFAVCDFCCVRLALSSGPKHGRASVAHILPLKA